VKFRWGFSFSSSSSSSSSSFYLALWRRGRFFRERHRRCSITTSRVPCSGCWISTFFAVRHFRFFWCLVLHTYIAFFLIVCLLSLQAFWLKQNDEISTCIFWFLDYSLAMPARAPAETWCYGYWMRCCFSTFLSGIIQRQKKQKSCKMLLYNSDKNT